MKHSFSFIKMTNWIYSVRVRLKELRMLLDREDVPSEEAIRILEGQKRQLLLLKEVMEKRVFLTGIQHDFLINLQQIKKDYGIED
jgi:hypothetical protein